MNINLMLAISSYLKNRKEKKSQKRKEKTELYHKLNKEFQEDSFRLGFNKVKFPILLVDGDLDETEFKFYDYEFTIVWDLDEFSKTGWYHSPSLDNECKILDCNGEIWNFKFNSELGSSIPDSLIKKLELNELKTFIVECINWRNEDEVKQAIENANSISSVFEVIEKHYKSFL